MAQQQEEMLPACCYDTENASVILEHMVDLNELAENDFDFRQNLKEMGWVKYFNTEGGREVFEEAIKEFWQFARMEEDDIVGYVKGFLVRVNPTLISEVIGCKNTGLEHSEKWEKELGGFAVVNRRSSIYKEPGATLGKDMKEDNRVLHKIIINNIIPKSGSVDTVSQDHIFVLWHYHRKTIVNLPALIFKFLKKAMDLSRKWNTSDNRPQQKNIPYARVLSALMENQGVINKLRQLPVEEQGKLLQVTFRKKFGVTNLTRMGLSSRRLELEEEELARIEEQDKAKSVASGRRGRGRGRAQATRSNAPRASAEVARKKIADQLFRPSDPKPEVITVYSDEEEETDKLVLQKQGSSSQASETPEPVPSPAKRKLVKKHQEESQSSKKQQTSESDEGIAQPISVASSTTPDPPRHSTIHIHSPGPYIPEPSTFIAFSSTVPPNPLDQSISKRLEEMDIIIQRDAELQSCVIIWQAIEDFYLEWILKDFQRALEKEEEEKLALEEKKKDKGKERVIYEAEECIAAPKSEYGKLLEHSEKIARLEQHMETSSKKQQELAESQEEIKKILNLLVSKFS